jgi:hypothetical protein
MARRFALITVRNAARSREFKVLIFSNLLYILSSDVHASTRLCFAWVVKETIDSFLRYRFSNPSRMDFAGKMAFSRRAVSRLTRFTSVLRRTSLRSRQCHRSIRGKDYPFPWPHALTDDGLNGEPNKLRLIARWCDDDIIRKFLHSTSQMVYAVKLNDSALRLRRVRYELGSRLINNSR